MTSFIEKLSLVANDFVFCNNRALQVLIYILYFYEIQVRKSANNLIFHQLNWTKEHN